MVPFPSPEEIKNGDYPKWDGNDAFEKGCLRAVGLPEDFHPDEEQGMHIVIAALED